MVLASANLGETDRQIYRTLLLNKKAEIQAALETNSLRLTEASGSPGARPDQILQEASVSVLMNRVLFGQLRQVSEALDRLEAGSYGSCTNCGDLIEAKRLQSVFWTQYCLGCREKISSSYSSEKIGVGGVHYAQHSEGSAVRM